MDFKELMKVIGVKKDSFELAPGFTVYLRLPSITKYVECTDPYNTIYNCVVDENGKPIFESPEQVEKDVELTVQVKLNLELQKKFTEAMNIEDVEKK
ncbi:hypothetical protein ACOJEA_004780 [Klebsiella aerogenes]